MRGLYLHLPFCAQKCHYCDFVITLDSSGPRRRRFFEALEKEIFYARRKLGRLSFDTVYFGGGTPSLLSADEMTWLVQKIRQVFDLRIQSPATELEFTCEFNPGDLQHSSGTGLKHKKTRPVPSVLRKLGINRVSLGAQAFQDSLLEAMGRQHRVADIEATVQQLHDAGIHNISFDLISGLPDQTLPQFEESLHRAVQLGASQISYYDLEIHEKTRWGRERGLGILKLPEEDTRAEMFQSAIDILTAAGYRQYEISTFAKPGFESQHNLIYWRNEEYLGLGPGAFSYLNGVRSQFSRSVPQYLQKCEAGDWEPAVKDVLSETEKETETLVTGLRLRNGVSLENFKIIRPVIERRLPELQAFALLDRAGSRISLTSRGRFLAEHTFGLLIGN